MICDCHIQVLHSGLNSTLNYLRNTYWICQGRKVVKQVIKDGVVCKKAQVWPLTVPKPPDLPSYRLSNDYAFSNTGIDIGGPLYVKKKFGDSDWLFKCYICLFTCGTTRNVPLELRPLVSAGHLIRYLKRFAGRTGKINLFISDNFQTFASNELKNFNHLTISVGNTYYHLLMVERILQTLNSYCKIHTSKGVRKMRFEL